MPLNWSGYLAQRGWNGHPPPADAERLTIERLAADILQIDPFAQQSIWGEAIGYGRNTLAVVRIGAGIAHAFPNRFAATALKIFRNSARTHVEFHREAFSRCPGLDPGRVQQTIAAGWTKDAGGKTHGYLVLEYVAGVTLEARLAADEQLKPPVVQQLLGALFLDQIIPLWSAGHRFWDFRKANLVLREPGGELAMIDADTLREGAVELLQSPRRWTVRDRKEAVAFRRLPGLVADVLMSARGEMSRSRAAAIAKAGLASSGLEICLRRLGRDPETLCRDQREAEHAVRRFLQELSVGESWPKGAPRQSC